MAHPTNKANYSNKKSISDN
uniref:Uncharacterized protein n=1 Tax=Rhizophora mucronata TaxID=61149 RepID=A0A2P2J4Y8_RHIMU